MEETGRLMTDGERYEFSFEKLGLVIRGAHPEWVLEAAAEIIADTEKLRTEGRIDELTALSEIGEADEFDIDDVRFEAEERFEKVPQCLVSIGSVDYRWISVVGRPEDSEERRPPVTRVHEMSLTRNNTFLKDTPRPNGASHD
ncbi:MAG: hypothetical protein AAF416_17420 [Pseudomonadota bacterium]